MKLPDTVTPEQFKTAAPLILKFLLTTENGYADGIDDILSWEFNNGRFTGQFVDRRPYQEDRIFAFELYKKGGDWQRFYQPVSGIEFSEVSFDTFAEEDEEDGDNAPDFFTRQLTPLASRSIENWFEVLRSQLTQLGSIEALRDRIPELYPELDSTDLVKVLGENLYAANLAGQYEALDVPEFADTNWVTLPFDKAIAFFRNKLNLDTNSSRGIKTKAQADAVFTVAGAKGSLLQTFRELIDTVLSQGLTFDDFQRSFDGLVASTGWAYNGDRNWRTHLIYYNNLSSAYSAGRWEQQSDPEVTKTRKYWIWRHRDSVVPRPTHLKADGLVLLQSDPFWQRAYPPCGWNCRCAVFSLSDRDLRSRGLKLGTAPRIPPFEIDKGWGGPPAISAQAGRQLAIAGLPEDLRSQAQKEANGA